MSFLPAFKRIQLDIESLSEGRMAPFRKAQLVLLCQKQVSQIQFVIDNLSLQFGEILTKAFEKNPQLLTLICLQFFTEWPGIYPDVGRIQFIWFHFKQHIFQWRLHSSFESYTVNFTLVPYFRNIIG